MCHPRSASDGNMAFWSKENPGITQSLEHIYRMDVDMGGYDVRLSDWTFLVAALWGTRTFHSF